MHPAPAVTAAKSSSSLSTLLQSTYKVSDNSLCLYSSIARGRQACCTCVLTCCRSHRHSIRSHEGSVALE